MISYSKAPILLGLAAAALILDGKLSSEPPTSQHNHIRRGATPSSGAFNLHIPRSLSIADGRALTINLGGGNCEWELPEYNVPANIDFHKTIIAGYPSGDKRMIFLQMEALTGWPAKDDWDFWGLGMSNHPFIKTNYPHHEGVWGWEDAADQVVLMVRNIRKSMNEYHDILWDIGYAKTWEEANLHLDKLYSERPPLEDWLEWRDLRVIDEILWYGWFIDYWMEDGLMRDMFTHKITTPLHWYMDMMPVKYTAPRCNVVGDSISCWGGELSYDLVVGADTVVTPSYDPHCSGGPLPAACDTWFDQYHCTSAPIKGSCKPVAVISAEKLRDYTEGPAETAKIANVLLKDNRMGQYVIDEEAWDCIWTELIVNKKGLKTVNDRPHAEAEYNFSSEMLQAMIIELNRLITKYSGPEWNTKETANRLVSLLNEHRALVQTELDEVNSGVRKLTDMDYLGPKERDARRKLSGSAEDKHDYSEYFLAAEQKMKMKRISDLKERALKTAREERIKEREVRLLNKMKREASALS